MLFRGAIQLSLRSKSWIESGQISVPCFRLGKSVIRLSGRFKVRAARLGRGVKWSRKGGGLIAVVVNLRSSM